MKNAPLISVVMPMYNNAGEVRRAASSVLAQTMTRFELIVVNDGSTDGCDAIVRGFEDPRIRVLTQKNKGVSAARNRGVSEAQSEVVAFLDADDEWMPDFLGTISRLMEKFSSCSVFATHYEYMELEGTTKVPVLRNVPSGEWEGVLENYFEVAAHSDPPLWSSAVAVRRAALSAVGGFPEGIAVGEDLLTWSRLAAGFQIAFSKKRSSVFWLRGSLTGYPTRVPEIPDTVGKELAALVSTLNSTRKKTGYDFLAMWHRMRASMFIQLNDRGNSIAEVKKMAEYAGWQPLVCYYLLVAMAPQIMRKFVVQFFTFVKTLRRRIRKT